MANQTNKGLSRIARATGNSYKGFAATWQNEEAFRQECYLALPLALLALWIGDSAAEIALMWLSLALVLLAELINSAIESVVDRVGLERHELSGRAKDQGSAAVALCMAMCALVYGLCFFW